MLTKQKINIQIANKITTNILTINKTTSISKINNYYNFVNFYY